MIFCLSLALFIFTASPVLAVAIPAAGDPAIGCELTPTDLDGNPVQVQNPAGGAAVTIVDVVSLGCLALVVANIIEVGFLLIGAVSVLVFIFGSLKFLTSGGNEKSVQSGRNLMIYSVGGAVFVISIFLIFGVLESIFPQIKALNMFSTFTFWRP